MLNLMDLSINEIKKEILIYESREERPEDLKITQIVIDPFAKEYINDGDFCVTFQAKLRRGKSDVIKVYEWNADKMKITLGMDAVIMPL